MNKNAKTPPGEMRNIDVDFISLVRKGANRQKVQIYKADTDDVDDPNTEAMGLMNAIKNFFIGKSGDDVEVEKKDAPKKSTSFAQSIAVSDIMDGMWRVNDTLREVMRNIVADEGITNKKTALSAAVDEFATYMKDKINSTTIAKADEYFDTPQTEIAKAGRTLSGKSLSAIKGAITALQGLLDNAEGNQEGEENTVNKEELQAVMKEAFDEALKPVTDRLDKLEKADGNGADGEPAGTENHDEGPDMTEVVKAAISDALNPITDRLDKLEKTRGVSKGLEDEGGSTDVNKADDTFAGLFI